MKVIVEKIIENNSHLFVDSPPTGEFIILFGIDNHYQLFKARILCRKFVSYEVKILNPSFNCFVNDFPVYRSDKH